MSRAYRINVKNCKYAEVTVNTDSTYTIGTPVAIPDLRNWDMTLTSATGELYGDGALVAKRAKLTGATVSFGIDRIDQDTRAKLNGHTIDSNGVLVAKTTDVPPTIALYGEVELDDGEIEQIWLLCGKVQPFGISATQAETGITYSTDTVTADFIARELDKAVLKLGDTTNSTFKSHSAAFAADPDGN